MTKPPVLATIEIVTAFHPTQWHGRTTDDRPVYIRFERGPLTVNIGPVGGTIDDAIASPCWFDEQIGDDFDEIDIVEVCHLTGLSFAD